MLQEGSELLLDCSKTALNSSKIVQRMSEEFLNITDIQSDFLSSWVELKRWSHCRGMNADKQFSPNKPRSYNVHVPVWLQVSAADHQFRDSNHRPLALWCPRPPCHVSHCWFPRRLLKMYHPNKQYYEIWHLCCQNQHKLRQTQLRTSIFLL